MMQTSIIECWSLNVDYPISMHGYCIDKAHMYIFYDAHVALCNASCGNIIPTKYTVFC